MMKRKLKTNGAPNQVAKGPLPIGVTVDGAEKGVNGVVVSGLSRNGALAKDGRVKVSEVLWLAIICGLGLRPRCANRS